MIIDQIKKMQQVLPANIARFLLRAFALVICWNLLYHLFLKPAHIPDNQLTGFIVWGTVKLLSLFYGNVHHVGSSVFLQNIQAVNIDPQCNGLELIVLYLGFLWCLPSGWKRMLLFAIAGVIVICFLNIVRCSLLAWMYIDMRHAFDFAHHYLFKLVIYAVVFYGWMLYSKKNIGDAL